MQKLLFDSKLFELTLRGQHKWPILNSINLNKEKDAGVV